MPRCPHPYSSRQHRRGHPAAIVLRDGGWREQKATPAPPSPPWVGPSVATQRNNKATRRRRRRFRASLWNPRRGQSPAETRCSRPPQRTQPGGFPRGQDVRQRPARPAPALSGGVWRRRLPRARSAARRARAMLRDAPGSARRPVQTDTSVKRHSRGSFAFFFLPFFLFHPLFSLSLFFFPFSIFSIFPPFFFFPPLLLHCRH